MKAWKREAKEIQLETQNPDACLCRLLRMDGLDQSLLETLSQEDWIGVIKGATWHALAPILYKRLKNQSSSDQVPTDLMRNLREVYIQYLSRGILRMHILSQLLSSFQNENIPVIPLKGTHLAEIVYRDPALRPMSDFDLLFHKSDLSRVSEKLIKQGYQPARAFWIEYQCSVSHELPPFLKPGSPPVEVDWTIILPTLNFNVDLDGLWDRASLNHLLGMQILLLSPEDLILHLCMHAATQHLLRSGLRLTYDIAASLEYYKNEIQWDTLLARAKQWNADRVTYLMLFLAGQLFGAPLPPGFLEGLRPENFDPEIVEVASNLIFMGRQDFSSFSPQLAALLKAKGTFAGIRLILSRILIPPAEMARLYPVLPDSPKMILYYPVRIKDVLLKHLPAGIKLARGEPSTVVSARLALKRSEQEDWLVKVLT